MSVEKLLMDTVIGSKETLQELLFESGIIQKEIDYRKSKVVMQGEGILPAIQQNLSLNLDLKSYFVVAQLHRTHMHVILHQVLKLLSPDENASTIIVRDKIIHIDNVHDTLCKNIWNSFQLNDKISYCTSHNDIESESCDLYSAPNHKNAFEKLKQHVSEILSTNTFSNLHL